jgi:hypothetical protein
MERTSVLLSTATPIMYGIGEAYQSWNSDHSSGTTHRTRAGMPLGARAPVSASATMSCSFCWSAAGESFFVSSLIIISRFYFLVPLGRFYIIAFS